jgi:arylsulfatase A-like enzyme
LNRRDFLKLLGVAVGGGLSASLDLSSTLTELAAFGPPQSKTTKPNIIVILLDALSARHLSLYNYQRKTSPNLDRLARRAIVYNNHYAPGHLTTPSTGSFFTGSYPWTHRALFLKSQIRQKIVPFNLFHILSPDYYQAAFTQNINADILLYQLGETLDEHCREDSFSLAGKTIYPYLGDEEALNVFYAYDGFQLKNKSQSGSLFLALLRDLSTQLEYKLQAQKYVSTYPPVNAAAIGDPDSWLSLPHMIHTDVYFILNQLFEGVKGMLDEVAMSAAKAAKPFLTYIHLLPPHAPYMPDSRYLGSFADGWAPKPKPDSRLLDKYIPQEQLDDERQRYDEYIANIDAEFGRLLDHLQESGRMDDSVLIVTSDHGETFERGEDGHSTPNVYEQLIRIPLLISVPGQNTRLDVTTLTSTVDMMPTLLKIAGVDAPQGAPLEGQVLPGFENWPLVASTTNADRSIFVVEAKSCPLSRRIQSDMATTALVKGHYKLVHYTRYPRARDRYEFYDLQNDPEELENLYKTSPIAREYQTELEQALLQAENRVFGER